jgi:hypothetical protein
VTITTLFRRTPVPDAGAGTVAPQAPSVDVLPPRWRRTRGVLRAVLTVAAVAVLMFALVGPNRSSRLGPEAYLRIPVEALLYVTLFLTLPPAWRRVRRGLAVAVGVGLGLLTIVKLLDMGFASTLNRPFDPMLDFPLAGNAYDFLLDSVGRPGAIAATVGVVVLIVVIPLLTTASVLRLTPMIGRHRTVAGRAVAVLAVAWVVLSMLGAQIVPATAIASRSAGAITLSHLMQVPDDLHTAHVFAEQSKHDQFANTPGDQMLTGLRGKDVVVSFIESYGRSAVESPGLSTGIDRTLDAGTRQLQAAGFASRSGWLTSPTAGGGSWLAQSTLLSGLWIKNQNTYDKFTASKRLTLNGAFHRADWRTLAVVPGVKKAWPQARVFGFDKIYDAHHLGYQGPHFGWSWVTDQYVLDHFQETEYGVKGRGPIMTEMPLTSSHMPWTPLPSMVDWNAVGDGSVFTPMAAAGASRAEVWKDPQRIRRQYAQSVQYSLTALTSWVRDYGDDDLVLVFLGDHQPIPLVAGENASHDVPITIVAKDPKVLEAISSWGWTDGLRPKHDAPVWPMDAFRDKFLIAFGSTPHPSTPGEK